MDIKFLLSTAFIQQCGDLTLDTKNGLLDEYNPFEGEPLKGIQHINLASIAKVCDTELLTIEMVLKEIVAQIKEHIKKGNNLRLLFKVGKLITCGSEIKWKSFKEENTKKVHDTESRYTSFSTRPDNEVTSIMHRSVMTPSVAKTRSQSHNLSLD